MDNWMNAPFASPVLPKSRPCEALLAFETFSPPSNPSEWWFDEDDHSKGLPLGHYAWFETLFLSVVGPYGTEDGNGSWTLTAELLDAAGAAISTVKISGTQDITFDEGVPIAITWIAGEVDLSAAKPVSTFNGFRLTLDAGESWNPPAGMLLVLGGRRAVLIEGHN